MTTPFKFLDPYTLKDKHVFFGRDEEIEAIYSMSYRAPISLIYGQSGTGKTSLIQCGLASRIDHIDWLPLFVRRHDDINYSLKLRVEEAFSPVSDKPFDNLFSALEELFTHYFRPPFLVFDQLEELFILGNQGELEVFSETIYQILHSGLKCKIIFIIREEYLAHLYHFEKKIPDLFKNRLRVEPLTLSRTKEVILKSFNAFNIKLEQPDQSTELILDNITSGKSQVDCSYLQVYLDMLYRECLIETNDAEIPNESPLLEITQKHIERMGRFEDILEVYLNRQFTTIQHELAERHTLVPGNVVQAVLDPFVTVEGTRRSWSYENLEKARKNQFSFISTDIFDSILMHLEQSRLLIRRDDTIELAQDSLARCIDQMRTAEQRTLNEARHRIRIWHQEFLSSGEYMSPSQLEPLLKFIPRLSLDMEILNFIERSFEYNKIKKRRARLMILIPWILIIVLCIIIFLLM